MNARLRANVLREAPRHVEQEPLKLLGEGLDAIIQRTRLPGEHWLDKLYRPRGYNRDIIPITPRQRLDRYYTAAALHPLYRDDRQADLRLGIGAQFLDAWNRRVYANLRRAAYLMPVPTRMRKSGAR